MSITFELEILGTVEAVNLSNPNAAALMTLAGLAPQAVGEVRGESLRACVARLLRVVNCEAARAHAIAHACAQPTRLAAERGLLDVY